MIYTIFMVYISYNILQKLISIKRSSRSIFCGVTARCPRRKRKHGTYFQHSKHFNAYNTTSPAAQSSGAVLTEKKKNNNVNKKISFPVGYLLSFFFLLFLFFRIYLRIMYIRNLVNRTRDCESALLNSRTVPLLPPPPQSN